MCQSVLQANGQVVPCRSLRRLHPDELAASNTGEIRKRAEFDSLITTKLGNSFSPPPKETAVEVDDCPIKEFDHSLHTPYEGESDPSRTIHEADLIDAAGKHLNQKSVTDLLINAEISLPKGEKLSMDKVIRRSVDDNGKLIKTYDDNILLNSHIYEVEFTYGEIKEFAANILAENYLSQVDSNGHHSQLLDCITNVRCDD